jgi:hypothetical protein
LGSRHPATTPRSFRLPGRCLLALGRGGGLRLLVGRGCGLLLRRRRRGTALPDLTAGGRLGGLLRRGLGGRLFSCRLFGGRLDVFERTPAPFRRSS